MRVYALMIVTFLAFCGACHGYEFSDLPTGWGIDPNQIEGEILPLVATDPNTGQPDPADPNTWMAPVGDFIRQAPTSKWIARLVWVATNTSDFIGLYHDIDKGWSTHWILDGWLKPGPNYKVIDAVSFRGWSGQEKTQRVTVVGIGVIPADAVVALY